MAMKKEEQERINAEVVYIESRVKHMIESYGKTYIGRLRYCNAEVYETYGFMVLKSYNTIVAAIDEFGYAYDFLRYVYGYTATSAQHISKFFEDYGASVICRWMPI